MTVLKMNFTRLVLLILVAFTSNFLTAQDLSKDEDFEKRWEKGSNNNNFGWHFDGNWNNDSWDDFRVGLLDVGFATYIYNGSLNLPAELDEFDQTFGGSLNFNLHVVRHRVPVIKDDLRLEYGLTVSWMSYGFSNDFQFLENTIPLESVDDGTSYKKNKLKTTFLEVPLMLTLIPGKNKNFNLSAGVFGGILLGSKQKIKTDEGDKIKIRDDFNLNKFRYGVVGRVGFGPIALYAEYSLTNLFKDGQGPELTPFNIGLTLLNY